MAYSACSRRSRVAVMDAAAAWQALGNALMGAQQPSASVWQTICSLQAMQNQAASSSGSQPTGAFGFPGTGAHANQSASDAALNYATMLQISEQARLIGMAESTLTSSSPPSNEHDLKNKIREVVRMEMKEAAAKNAASDVRAKVAEGSDKKLLEEKHAAENEAKLDKDRRKYEKEREEETKRSDRRAITIAKEAYQREEREKEQAANKAASEDPPPPKARPGLRCVGGYKVEGGYIEVYSKFKPHHIICKETKTESTTKASEEEVINVEDNKAVSTGTFKTPAPMPPPYPPHLGPPPQGINPPPPPVDVEATKKRQLRSITCHAPTITCYHAIMSCSAPAFQV